MKLTNKIQKILETTFNVKRALGFVWNSSRGWALLNIVLLVIQGILPIISIFLLKILVDSVASAINQELSDNELERIYFVLFAVGIVLLFTGLTRVIGNLVNKEQSRRVSDYMHDIIHEKAIEVDLEYYENPEYQDTLHRAQEESTFRPGIIVNAMTNILQNLISLLGVAWLLLVFRWPILLVLIAAVFPGLIVRFIFSSKEYLNERKYTRKERAAAYYHWMLVYKDLAKEIRVFNLGKTFIERFRNIRQKLRKIRLELDKKSALYSSLSHIFTTILIFLAYFWVVRDAVMGVVTIGTFVMFYQAFNKGQLFLQNLLDGIARLYENNLFLTNLYEFLDIGSTIKANKSIEDNISTNVSVTLENVSFSYPSSDKQVLQNVNLHFDPGQVIALVGRNGSGKTTLVKLICRLYDVNAGTIFINGIDIRNYSQTIIRKKIGVIFQDYPHYNLSVRDNIWFGDVDRDDNEDNIRQAAEKAGAGAMIPTLANGYDTILGRMFERGIELSEGQWQKIALSRAFFRDTQMIILDEPTSAMDPKAEYELFQKFKEILDGRTALLISHRMSTVRMADKIFVLDDGRIVETGNHHQLIEYNGIYADLFQTQARNYL